MGLKRIRWGGGEAGKVRLIEIIQYLVSWKTVTDTSLMHYLRIHDDDYDRGYDSKLVSQVHRCRISFAFLDCLGLQMNYQLLENKGKHLPRQSLDTFYNWLSAKELGTWRNSEF